MGSVLEEPPKPQAAPLDADEPDECCCALDIVRKPEVRAGGVSEHGHPEAAGEVEVLAAAGVDDATPLSRRPDQAEPLRRGTSRPSVSVAM